MNSAFVLIRPSTKVCLVQGERGTIVGRKRKCCNIHAQTFFDNQSLFHSLYHTFFSSPNTYIILISQFITFLFHLSSYYSIPQTRGLKNNRNLSLTVPETRSLRPRCQQIRHLVRHLSLWMAISLLYFYMVEGKEVLQVLFRRALTSSTRAPSS